MLNLRVCAAAIALLISASALAAPSADQLTRFFRSVQVDDARTVRTMVVEGTINPNALDPRSGEPGLIVALREGASSVAATLIALPGIDLEATAPNDSTALMMAAYKRNRQIVDALLARGAEVNRPGYSPLHFAAASGDEDITRLLLAKGAAIDARAAAATTPLMLAAREGQEATVAVLLAAGADAALVNSEGLNAEKIALRADKPRIAAVIRAHGK